MKNKLKLTLIVFLVVKSGLSMADNTEFLKFITNNTDTIIIHRQDIINIDTAQEKIILTEEIASKIKNLDISNTEVFFYGKKKEWEKIKIINVFEEEIESSYKYLFEINGSLLFEMGTALLYGGLQLSP